MSLWTRLLEAIEALAAGTPLSEIIESFTRPPEKTLAFTVAVIALGAKMAKADGLVTRDEVTAFREVFRIEKEDEAHAARVFNLARQDVVGFESYATSIARMFGDNKEALTDLLEGLFYIASADGVYHPQEEGFLRDVANIFGLTVQEFEAVQNRAAPGELSDPYAVLGVSRDDALSDIKSRWQAIVRETHPDRMMARGVPEEAINMANHRMTVVNDAWARIQKERGR